MVIIRIQRSMNDTIQDEITVTDKDQISVQGRVWQGTCMLTNKLT